MSNITLYSLAPVDRSARVRWFFEEAGIDFEQVWMNPQTNEHMGDAYRRVNPFGKVPGVERDGDALYESGAIILDTLERDPDSPLAPNPGDGLCLESGGNWFWRLSERVEFCGGQAARSRVSSAIS